MKWLKDQFPGKKIGLIWDHAPAHTNGVVDQFLRDTSSWLKTELIPWDLTSVLQVCDLIINKPFKQHVRNGYYRWRTTFVRQQRDSGVTGKLNIKIPRDVLINLIENAVKQMNRKQRETPTIRAMFQSVGQDPFVNCSEQFKIHLDSLSKDSMYRNVINAQRYLNIDTE